MHTHLTNTHTRPHSRRAAWAALLAAPLAVGLVTLPASPAAARPPLTCGTTVTTDVRLTADLLDCDGAGLVVGAPGITIDLAGHTIDGTGTASSIGIDNLAGHDDVRVIRGTIREFASGLDLLETTGNRLDRLTLEANGLGVIVERSAGVELDRITATHNTFTGISVNFSEQATVRRSTASGNGQGGVVDLASIGTRYERNTVTGNVSTGFTMWQSQDAVVERNHVTANEFDGIQLSGVVRTVLERNEVAGNGGDGIVIDEAGNTVTRNRAVANQGIGIAAPDGTIDGAGNRASGNLGGNCTAVACR